MTMAWQNQQASDTNNNYDNVLKALQVASAASRVDPAALLGYGIGSYLKNYINNGRQRGANDAATMQATNNNSYNQQYSTAAPDANAFGQTTADSLILGQPAAAQQNPANAPGYNQTTANSLILGAGPGTSSGQNLADSATQTAAARLTPGLLGSTDNATATAQQMAQSANQQPQANNDSIAQIQAAQQQQAAAANQQAIAQQQAKKQALLKLGIAAATGGLGGDSSSAGNAGAGITGAAGPSLTFGNSNFFGQAAPGDSAAASKTGQALDYVARNLAQQLITAKQAYAIAQSQNDTAGMSQAAQAAQSIRNSARDAGINLDGFGADNTLQEAQQNYQTDLYRGLNNVLNHDMTSDEYYQQVYDRVRKAGYTDTEARKAAAQRAGIYQAQRVARLSGAFQNYGLNPSGSMNNIGVQILSAMGQENPGVANVFANMYGTPKDDYNYGHEIEKQNNFANNQLRNTTTVNSQENEFNKQMAVLDAQLKEAQAQRNFQRTAYLQQQKAVLSALYGGGGKGSQGSGYDSDSSKGSSGKITESQRQTIESVLNLLTESENIVKGDQWDNDGDGSTIDANQKQLQKMYDEGKIPNDVWTEEIYPRLAAIQKDYQHRYGYKGQGE